MVCSGKVNNQTDKVNNIIDFFHYVERVFSNRSQRLRHKNRNRRVIRFLALPQKKTDTGDSSV